MGEIKSSRFFWLGFSVLHRLEILVLCGGGWKILALKFDWMVERVGSEGGVGSLDLTCHSFIYLTGTRKLGYRYNKKEAWNDRNYSN